MSLRFDCPACGYAAPDAYTAQVINDITAACPICHADAPAEAFTDLATGLRDYGGARAMAENGGEAEPATDWLVCSDCGRPMYYDRGDDLYHHAIGAGEGCFLIPAEDRPDDVDHPLIRRRRKVAVALLIDVPAYLADASIGDDLFPVNIFLDAGAELVLLEVHPDPAAIFPTP